jgi:hypothetical protein
MILLIINQNKQYKQQNNNLLIEKLILLEIKINFCGNYNGYNLRKYEGKRINNKFES